MALALGEEIIVYSEGVGLELQRDYNDLSLLDSLSSKIYECSIPEGTSRLFAGTFEV